MDPEREIHEVKRRHSAELLQLPGVSGVGVGKGKHGGLAITVHVESDNAAVVAKLPQEIEGFPVEVVRSDSFKKL